MTAPTQLQDETPGMDDLAALVAAQARTIDDLRARLETLERRTSAALPDGVHDDEVAAPDGSREVRPGRRQLLSLAGMAAAGAVAGTTVLAAQATPAAAASGTFDGTPAVTATSPSVAIRARVTDGTAIEATAQGENDTGVFGLASSTTGINQGLWGQTDSSEGHGVIGLATAEEGAGRGVYGMAAGGGGVGVMGQAGSAVGTPVGLMGIAEGPNGFGAWIVNSSTSGDAHGLKAVSHSSEGIGVASDAVIGLDVSASWAHLRLTGREGDWPAPPYGAGGVRQCGELVFDGARWWACVRSGEPGEWRLVAGPTTAGSLHVLDAAVRAYDSRPGFEPAAVRKGKLAQDQQRTLDLQVGGGVPAMARAALVNVTVTNTSAGGGFLKMFKSGASVPTASVINWSSGGQNIANSATVALAGGLVTVRCGGAGASTDFIVDVSGYYL